MLRYAIEAAFVAATGVVLWQAGPGIASRIEQVPPVRLAVAAPAPSDALAGEGEVTSVAAPAERGVTVPMPAAAPRRPTTIETLRITRELPETRWLPPGEFIWDAEAAAAQQGQRAVVVVNLRARVISVYKGGVEVGRSSILYGAPDKPTPTGTFPILEKRRDHVSNIYDAPMPHMQRLTWDGVALHGSPRLGDNLATNGCVGLPREFAALLFEVTRVGDEVIVWSGLPQRA